MRQTSSTTTMATMTTIAIKRGSLPHAAQAFESNFSRSLESSRSNSPVGFGLGCDVKVGGVVGTAVGVLVLYPMFSMLNAAGRFKILFLSYSSHPSHTTSWVFGCHKIRRKKIESGGYLFRRKWINPYNESGGMEEPREEVGRPTLGGVDNSSQ